MIVVNIFNGMEIELNSNEGPVSENLKIFRHFYYAKMCNLLFRSGLTKDDVSELTAPDFVCTYIDVRGDGFTELHFERNVPVAVCAAPAVKKEEPVVEVTEEPKNEETVETKEEVKTESVPEAPVKRGRGRPKKTVA